MPPTMMHTCVACDRNRMVIRVLVDDLQLLHNHVPPVLIDSLFDERCAGLLEALWRDLTSRPRACVSNLKPAFTRSYGGGVSAMAISAAEEYIISFEAEASIILDHLTNFAQQAQQNRATPLPDAVATIPARNETDSDHVEMVALANRVKAVEKEFQMLSSAINDAIWDWNIARDTIKWNAKMTTIFGYQAAQFPRDLAAWAALIHPEDRDEVLSTLKQILQQRSSVWKFMYRYKCFNKSYKYTFDKGFIVYDDERPVRMISVMQDIDERMISLHEIEKLSMVASNTDNMVIITDPTERIEWVNAGFTRRTGYTMDEVIGKTPRTLQGPETSRSTLDVFRNAIDARESVTAEVLNYAKDGTTFWVRININPVFDEVNRLVRFVAVQTDITLQKEFEAKISTIATDLTNLIATVNAPVVGLDRGGCISEWNNFAAELTDYSAQDMLGTPFVNLVHEPFREEVVEHLNAVFEGARLGNIELPVIARDGKKIIVLINATPRRNVRHEIIGVFLVGQDITALTLYRESLETSVRERTQELEAALRKEKELVSVKTRFAAMVSHEFRTPLSTIKISANHLRRYRSRLSSVEIDGKLAVIDEQVVHMTHMLEDVLMIGKSDEGRIAINSQRVDIMRFVESIKAQVENQFKNSHEVKCSFELLHGEINADLDLLRNIFINLLSNAIKFSPGKQHVYLDVAGRADRVVFKVIDKGIGIPPSDADRIFNPFDRGGNTTSIPGTGLGLSIVKKALDMMHGEITFSSSPSGTTFVVSLPVESPT